MRMRPKTIRRLMILFGGLCIVAAVIAWAVLLDSRHLAARMKTMRAQAMTSYNAGHYETAVKELGQYLDASKSQDTDREALFAYGKSRINVEMPRLEHVYEGIQIFQQYLQQAHPGDPHLAGARKLLLNLYVQAQYNQEAVKLADDILSHDPKDIDALQAKIKALSSQGNYSAALDSSHLLNQVAPFNLAGQKSTVLLMQQMHRSDAEMLKYVQDLREKYPQDPRFEVLTALTYRAINRNDEAHTWLHQAAGRPDSDPAFVTELASLLDQSEMYSDSAALIRSAAEKSSDMRLQRLLVERLWQDGQVNELLDKTKGVDVANADSQLLGYRALALLDGNHAVEGQKIVAALALRIGDRTAQAWAIALKARYSNLPPLAQVREVQQAIEFDSRNPSLDMMLAQAYRAMGETELAITSLHDAALLAPAWAAPHVMAAWIFHDTGRYDYALDTANDAVKRAPQSSAAQAIRTLSMYASVMAGSRDVSPPELLARLADSQKDRIDPLTLAPYVDILAQAGRRNDALTAIQKAIADKALPQKTLLDLSNVSDVRELGQGDAIREQAQKVYGLTPEIAAAEAQALFDSQKPADGLRLLQNAANGKQPKAPWALAIAQYKELIGDATAQKDWIALGDQNPHDLQVQTAVLDAPSVRQDRAFWERSIDRLKELTGEQGLAWQIERSRWLLAGPMTEKDKGEAVNLLTEVAHAAPTLAEPHHLLAIALEKVNNIPRAITEWTAAADASHGDPRIAAELIRILVDNDRTSDALSFLDRMAQNPALGDLTHQWIAQRFAELNQPAKAIALLEADKARRDNDPRRDALLGSLYARAGKLDQATSNYQAILKIEPPDPQCLLAAADFFAGHGKMSEAQACMKQIEQAKLLPGQRELYQAQFADHWGDDQKANALYEAATRSAPGSLNAWTDLAGYQMRHWKFADAAKAAGEGLKSLPDNQALMGLRNESLSLSKISAPQSLEPLVELLSHNPLDGGANEMLAALVEALQSVSPADNAADRSREVAEKYPANVALQVQAARLSLEAGRIDRAIELARRASLADPTSPAPSSMLAHIYLAMGDYFHAAEADERWRRRSADNPLEADLLGAQIALRQPRRDAPHALELLAPYVNASLADGQKSQVLAMYCSALIASGRSDEAAKLLQPLVVNSPRWRITWLSLTSAGHKDLDSASQWVTQIQPLISRQSPSEELALADAWFEVGIQFDSAQALLAARDLLKPIISRADASGEQWLLWGNTNQSLGDLPAAEAGYRKAMMLAPKSPDAKNDLAYVLWLENRDQDQAEALKLAEAAVAAEPGNANFYDTLARVQASNGLQDAATHSFRTALQKDPGSVEAMIGLADLLSKDQTRRSEVKDLLLQVNRLLPNVPPLSKPLQKQLEGLRSTVARAS